MLFGLLLAGCDHGCSREDPGASAGAAPSSSAAVEPPESPVEVIEQGAARRIKLAVKPPPKTRYEVKLQSLGAYGLVGRPPAPSPGVTLTLSYRVLGPAGSSTAAEGPAGIVQRGSLEWARITPPADPSGAAVAPIVLDAVADAAVRQVVLPDGRIADQSLEVGDQATVPPIVARPILATLTAVRNLPFRLPDKPVGVGAVWAFERVVEVAGVDVEEKVTSRLVSIGTRRAVIKVQVAHRADPQPVAFPFEQGKESELRSMAGQGEGRIVVDRDTGLIMSARLATHFQATVAGREGADRPTVATFFGNADLAQISRFLVDDAGSRLDAGAVPEGKAP